VKNSTRSFGVKARAILAGSLVLGVGAAVTLASWNDSEFAAGAFTGGKFNVQSSITGGTAPADWKDNGTGTPAALSFAVDANKLSPNTTVFAPFALKLAAGSTNAADITIKSTGPVGIGDHLVYTIRQTSTWGCNAATTGTFVAPAANVKASPVNNAFSLSTAGAPTYLCIAVTSDSTLEQGTSGTVTWEFAAVSNAAL